MMVPLNSKEMHFFGITYHVFSNSTTAHVLSDVERVIELTLPKCEQNCSKSLFCIAIGILSINTRLVSVDVACKSILAYGQCFITQQVNKQQNDFKSMQSA